MLGKRNMRRRSVIRKKLLMLMILMLSLMLTGGCASTSEKVPFEKGVDYIGLEKGEQLTAPVRGQFLSDAYYKYREEACK
jgi:hypothetical protein